MVSIYATSMLQNNIRVGQALTATYINLHEQGLGTIKNRHRQSSYYEYDWLPIWFRNLI